MYVYIYVCNKVGSRSVQGRSCIGRVGNKVGAASVGSGTRSEMYRSGREQGRRCIGRVGIGLLFCRMLSMLCLLVGTRESLSRWPLLGRNRQFMRCGLTSLPSVGKGSPIYDGKGSSIFYKILKARQCHDQPCSWVFLNVTDLIYIIAKGCS